jgi:hypothetical protein
LVEVKRKKIEEGSGVWKVSNRERDVLAMCKKGEAVGASWAKQAFVWAKAKVGRQSVMKRKRS